MKTKRILMLSAIILVGLSLLTGCQEQLPQQQDLSLTEKQMIREVTPVIQGFLDAQYEYALRKTTIPGWEDFILTGEGGKALKKRLDSDLRYQDAFGDGFYSAYTSRVDFSSGTVVQGTGDLLYLHGVFDRFTLTTSFKDAPPIITRASFPYDFTLQKIDGEWKILDWKEKHFLAPEGRWYSPDPEENLRLWKQSKEREKEKKLRSSAYSSGYDRVAAVNYALAHYDNPSANYPNYTNYGGDCTNFVSQCLEAGGWNQTSMSLPRASEKAWYHKKGSAMPALQYRSMSWTSAKALSKYLAYTDRVVKMSFPFNNYEVGDIVQYLRGSVGHSMIVTRKEEGKLYLTYRSINGMSDSDWVISSFGGFTFWKIAD